MWHGAAGRDIIIAPYTPPTAMFLVQHVRVPYSTLEAFIRNSVTQERHQYIDLVKYWAEYYENDIDLALCLVYYESGFNPLAKNRYSTASGLGQFIRSTWNSTLIRMDREYDSPFNAELNAEAFNWLLKKDGYTHWIVWRNCI